MKKTRNANLEILRILSVLSIVGAHYASFGFFAEELNFSRNKFFVDMVSVWGHMGTYLLTMVTGYFMVGSKLRMKKLLSVMGSVWFYTIGFFLIFTLSGLIPADRAAIKISFFPLLSMHYWYISYYLLLMLLLPAFNCLLRAMNRKTHAALCLLFFVCCLVLPKYLHISFVNGPMPMYFTLYVFGSYIRLYARQDRTVAKRSLILALVWLLLCALTLIGIDVIGQRTGNTALLENSIEFMGYTSPVALVGAVLLMVAYCCREPRENRFVAGVGGLTIGVYLFHCNQLFSSMVWQKVFHTAEYTYSPWLPLHAVAVILCLFAAGCVVEWLRQKTVARLWDRLIDALLPLMSRVWNACTAFGLRAWDGLLGTED